MKLISSTENPSEDNERIDTQFGGSLTPPLGIKDVQRLRSLISEISAIVNSENVERMPPNPQMTAFEALLVTICENPPNAVIIYEEADTEIFVRASRMNRADVVYLLEKAKLQVLGAI